MDSTVVALKILYLIASGSTNEYIVGDNFIVQTEQNTVFGPASNSRSFYELIGDPVFIYTTSTDGSVIRQNLSVNDYPGTWIVQGETVNYQKLGSTANYLGYIGQENIRTTVYPSPVGQESPLSHLPMQEKELRVNNILTNFPRFPSTPLLKFLPFYNEVVEHPDLPPFLLRSIPSNHPYKNSQAFYQKIISIEVTSLSRKVVAQWKTSIIQ